MSRINPSNADVLSAFKELADLIKGRPDLHAELRAFRTETLQLINSFRNEMIALYAGLEGKVRFELAKKKAQAEVDHNGTNGGGA